jgi:ML-like domain
MMAAGRSSLLSSWLGFLVLVGTLLSFAKDSFAATGQDNQYVQYTNSEGQSVWLADSRRPALYTQNFGDCMGDSLINVTRFDAAYYKDNMTVLFHLAGNSALTNQSLMRMLPPSSIAYGLELNPVTFQFTSASLPTESNVSS